MTVLNRRQKYNHLAFQENLLFTLVYTNKKLDPPHIFLEICDFSGKKHFYAYYIMYSHSRLDDAFHTIKMYHRYLITITFHFVLHYVIIKNTFEVFQGFIKLLTIILLRSCQWHIITVLIFPR